jgi:predicted nucleic acid-binding protein
MKRTYIDSGVLIAAIRGIDPIAQKAMAVIDDPEREYVSSMFVKLEVLPKPIYHKQDIEQEFYETFFQGITMWAKDFDLIIANAYQEACDAGINALDALHIAAAVSVKADEFITTENLTKPIHRATSVRVVALHTIEEETVPHEEEQNPS